MEYGLVALWLVAYAALTALALPVAARLFPTFSGRGVGLAPTIALAVLTIGGFAAGHVGMALALPAGLGLLIVVAAVATLDWTTLRQRGPWAEAGGEDATTTGRDSLLAVDVDRRAVVEVALVFAGGFLLVVAIRAVDPAVHPLGGEKFLDFGLLQTLARAEALPPQDMWFAGEPVQYYYGGHLTASLLAQLTGTPSRFAYNLALAGFYAALVTAAYELAGAIGAYRDVPRQVAGAGAVFFVGLASNLLTAGRVVLGWLPPALQRSVAEQVAAQTSQSTAEDLLAGVDEFSYWTASRVIDGTINEFPLFAWLNGDLHAHMMGTPFLLLAAALSYSYYRTPGRERWRRRLLVFLVVPLLAGLVAVVDTWSFPSVFGLLVLSIALAPTDPLSLFPRPLASRIRKWAGLAPADLRGRGPVSLRAEALRPAAAIAAGAIAGLIGVAFASPFLLSAVGGERTIALLAAAERSSLGGLVLVHGAFLAAFAAHLIDRIDPDRPWVLAAAIALLAAVALSIEAPVLLVVAPLGVAAWIGLRLARPLGYEAVLILAGAGLVTIVEFLYVVEQAGPLRLNTVFKVYAQVWVLWGVAAGVAVPGLLSEREHVAAAKSVDTVARPADTAARSAAATESRPGSEARTTPGTVADGVGPDGGSDPTAATGSWPNRSGIGGTVAVVVVVGLILSTSIYGGLALSAHFDRGGPGTLDATAFVERDHPEDAPAIEYVDGLEGQPTLVSAPATSQCLDLRQNPPCPPGMYDWDSSPAASLTGVPTVAGWAHEIGYRGAEPYRQRASDVDAIYTGDAETRARLLVKYDVEYVWVGNAERERYGEVSFAETPGVEPVFEEGRVTLYRVDRDRLSVEN